MEFSLDTLKEYADFNYICENITNSEFENFLELMFDEDTFNDTNYDNYVELVDNSIGAIFNKIDDTPIEFYEELCNLFITEEMEYSAPKNINGLFITILLSTLATKEDNNLSDTLKKDMIELFTNYTNPEEFYSNYCEILPKLYKELIIVNDAYNELVLNYGDVHITTADKIMSLDYM